jgi:hypothetical protein
MTTGGAQLHGLARRESMPESRFRIMQKEQQKNPVQASLQWFGPIVSAYVLPLSGHNAGEGVVSFHIMASAILITYA